MKTSADISFLWPQASSKSEAGVITTKTSGYEGDCHWTGERRFLVNDEFYETWNWVFLNRHAFPPVFDDDLLVAVKAYFESDLSKRYRDRGIKIPQGHHDLFIHAYWSGDSLWAETKLKDANLPAPEVIKIDPLPKNEHWGFLTPFCRGYGEYLTFEEERCTFYAPLGREKSAILGYLDMIRKDHEDRTRRDTATPTSRSV
jgi:hypothetical protein